MAVLAGVDDDEAECETAEHDEDRRDRRVDDAVGDRERLDHEGQDDAEPHDTDPEDGGEGPAQDETRGLGVRLLVELARRAAAS